VVTLRLHGQPRYVPPPARVRARDRALLRHALGAWVWLALFAWLCA
jgi:hypothetical protein